MIRYQSTKQVKIEEFSTPFEMNMDPDNRWVKLASKVPWDELATIYHKSMDNNEYLQELTEKAQQMIDRKISYRCTTPQEAEAVLKDCPAALLLYDSSKERE